MFGILQLVSRELFLCLLLLYSTSFFCIIVGCRHKNTSLGRNGNSHYFASLLQHLSSIYLPHILQPLLIMHFPLHFCKDITWDITLILITFIHSQYLVSELMKSYLKDYRITLRKQSYFTNQSQFYFPSILVLPLPFLLLNPHPLFRVSSIGIFWGISFTKDLRKVPMHLDIRYYVRC